MQRHPFFGIVESPAPASAVESRCSELTRRRAFLVRFAAGGVGVLAMLLGRHSRGQEVRIVTPVTPPGTGGSPSAPSGSPAPAGGGRFTTQALGEEGGSYYPPSRPGTPPPGTVTTYALGEEGGGYYRPPYPTTPPPGTVTTQAVGEEGGSGYYRPRRPINRSPRYYFRYE